MTTDRYGIPVDADTRCDVCLADGPAADRCRFGHPSGPCSCWRGDPCQPSRCAACRHSHIRLPHGGRCAECDDAAQVGTHAPCAYVAPSPGTLPELDA